MTETIERAFVRAASDKDSTTRRGIGAAAAIPLDTVPASDWRALAHDVLEPNAYYLPDWELAVNASARGRTGVSALCARSEAPALALIGLLPVTSLWRTYKLPLPALVSAQPYGTLCTPLLDPTMSATAATQLLQAARDSGAHALVLRDVTLDDAAMGAIATALGHSDLRPRVLQFHARACLDATRDGDTTLHDALGARKLKRLQRQRNHLAAHGEVEFEVARTPRDVAAALETFLALEASGWKGRRGTALVQHDGDAAFIRRATTALAGSNQCEIVTLRVGATAIAAAIVPRHQGRAYFFKIGIDERFASYSPGVQLSLDLTRHLCADPAITSADSTAAADNTMINPIWRGRLTIGDVLVPLYRRDPVVEMIDMALHARRSAFDLARHSLHLLRSGRKA